MLTRLASARRFLIEAYIWFCLLAVTGTLLGWFCGWPGME